MHTDRGFVKFMRSKQAEELMKDPQAFTLLAQIAVRAKRTSEASVHDLEIGEALIGDYKSCGMTEKEYRNRKKRLSRMGLATFRGTNKGTIAKLINTGVFDINEEKKGEQDDDQRAKKGRTRGERRATNNKDKNEKNEKKDKNRTDDRPTHRKVGGLTVPERPEEKFIPMPEATKKALRLKKENRIRLDEVKQREKLRKQAELLLKKGEKN